MKNSWTKTFRRLASGAIIVGSASMWSAMCYAQAAYDDASDAVYNDGWQEGDNGGYGWGPWNFDGTVTNAPIVGDPDLADDGNQQAIDDGLQAGTQPSSQHNDIGRAWTLFNHNGPNPGAAPDEGTDLAEAGRSLNGILHVNQTLSIVIDNPTEKNFFRGWTIKLNSGGANGCYAGDNCSTPAYDPGTINTKLAVGTFEYFSYGKWFSPNGTPLFDTDTNDGLQIDVTRTGRQTYHLKMTSPGNAVYEEDGSFAGLGSVDWLEVEFYNTDSDTYPTLLSPRGQTDFYIRSVSLSSIPEPASFGLLIIGGAMFGGKRRRRD